MDPISDLFIRIKNAQKAGHESAQITHSKFKHEIVKTLERAGLVGRIERKGRKTRKLLGVTLRYHGEIPVITDVRLISKPSRRMYASYKDIGRSRHGGVLVLTTPRGVMTDEEARKAKVGGQLIAEVW